ncbi:MAG TPA: TonB family protein [Mucilaginibacter sp.]|nr:TonB family protein [Mucilaginibacter sp.]
MKHLYLILFLLITPFLSNAQTNSTPDTAKRKVFTSVEVEPAFPGGINQFYQYINTHVQYPDVALLLGVNGKVTVSFWVDKSGRVVDVKAQKSLGSGCEYEAAKVVSSSPRWRPGIQNGRPVRVQYTVEVSFTKTKRKIAIKELKDSAYGFVFNINNTLYTIDEAEAQLGETFKQAEIESTELFYNPDNDRKFIIAGKKEIYLIKLKS